MVNAAEQYIKVAHFGTDAYPGNHSIKSGMITRLPEEILVGNTRHCLVMRYPSVNFTVDQQEKFHRVVIANVFGRASFQKHLHGPNLPGVLLPQAKKLLLPGGSIIVAELSSQHFPPEALVKAAARHGCSIKFVFPLHAGTATVSKAHAEAFEQALGFEYAPSHAGAYVAELTPMPPRRYA